jgi:hypothetical protein
MAFTNVFDVTQPPDTQLANLLGQDLRNLSLNVQQRMAAISGISTALPAFGSDAQPTNWTGILCFATDNGHLYQWSGSAWVDITTTFLPGVFFDSTVLNSAGTFTPGVVIPANYLEVGSIISVDFPFDATTSGADEFTIDLRLNGTNIATGVINSAYGGIARLRFYCTAIGVSGQLIGQNVFPIYVGLSPAFGNNSNAAPISVNLTNTATFSLFLNLSGSAAGSVGPLTMIVTV